MARTDRKIRVENLASDRKGWWIYTILYCALILPFFLYSLLVIKHVMFIAITGLFAAFGLFYLWIALRASVNIARFGDLQLLLEDPPPAPGGRLTGLVPLPPALLKAPAINATLTCHRVTFHGKFQRLDGDKVVSESNEKVPIPNEVWTQTVQLPIVRTGRGGVVKVSMAVPAGLQPTRMPAGMTTAEGARAGEDYWKWDLRLTADIPGIDLDVTFPVIVAPAGSGAASAAAVAAAAMPAARPLEAAVSAEMKPAAASPPVDASSLWLLVAVNLVPIAGIAFWGWRVHEIVFLYWIENLVIGVANIVRMWNAAPQGAAAAADATIAKLMMIGFFMVHYGLFCFVHGIFLATLFPVVEGSVGIGSPVGVLVHMLMDLHALAAIGAIVVSHAWSYFRNYIGRGEYLRANLRDLMTRPYKRIAVTHIFLFVGGFAVQHLEAPLLAMVSFIALKIGFDIYYHRREHGPGTARRA